MFLTFIGAMISRGRGPLVQLFLQLQCMADGKRSVILQFSEPPLQ